MAARDALWTPGGVVDAVDARLGMAALLATSGASSLDVATGVVGGPGDPLKVSGTADVGPMRVSVAAGHFIGSKGASNGPYIGCNDAPSLVDIAAAPASGSRYDRVWIRQRDAQAIVSPDADTGAEVGVTTGVSGTSPTEPAIPTGAVELARVQVDSGATATNGSGVTITDRRKWVGLRDGILAVPAEADLPATGWDGKFAVTLDTFRVWVWRSGAWAWAPWGQGQIARSGGGIVTTGNTETTFITISSIVLPSQRRLRLDLVGHVQCDTSGAVITIRAKANDAQVNGHDIRPQVLNVAWPYGTLFGDVVLAAGTHTVTATIQRTAGSGVVQTNSGQLMTVTDAGPA